MDINEIKAENRNAYNLAEIGTYNPTKEDRQITALLEMVEEAEKEILVTNAALKNALETIKERCPMPLDVAVYKGFIADYKHRIGRAVEKINVTPETSCQEIECIQIDFALTDIKYILTGKEGK